MAEFEGMGYGLRCSSRLETGAQALFVPSSVIFSGGNGIQLRVPTGKFSRLVMQMLSPLICSWSRLKVRNLFGHCTCLCYLPLSSRRNCLDNQPLARCMNHKLPDVLQEHTI